MGTDAGIISRLFKGRDKMVMEYFCNVPQMFIELGCRYGCRLDLRIPPRYKRQIPEQRGRSLLS